MVTRTTNECTLEDAQGTIADLRCESEKTVPSDYWYTPEYILDAINDFFYDAGYFDPCPIDPTFDGLAKSTAWSGDCYINPPYSQPLRGQFIDKGLREHWDQNSKIFLWLINFSNTVDRWKLYERASAVIIPEKRIKFIPGHPDLGDGKSPRYDSIFVLWGDPDGLKDAFRHIGAVYEKR